MRVKVNLFLDIPHALSHRLNKQALHQKSAVIDGADWPKSVTYCTNARCACIAKAGP